jgi:RNA polymerase sigma factor (sigma-70 family)
LSDNSNIFNTNSSIKDTPSDHDEITGLIRDCLASKRSAQRTMFEKFAPQVYNTIRRYISKEEPAKEILNDTFFKVFTRLHQFNWQGPFEGWIRRIAINTIMDHQRKYIKAERLSQGEIREDDAWVDSSAVEDISFKELVAYTYELKETHRIVFNLYVFENLSHKEIAETMNISEGNSRWMLNEARKKLKEKIISR